MKLFVGPALRILGGGRASDVFSTPLRALWAGPARGTNPREQYLPVRVIPGDDGVTRLEPVKWNSSAEVVGISNCAALAVQPIDTALKAGDVVVYRRLA